MIKEFLQSLYTLAVDMGFYMTIGLLLVAILNIFIKKQWIAKHLGGSGVWSIVKASIMGVPLPLCSCGVVPSGLYLKEKGASDSSAVSFLISTPQTGADSIIATYGLMGPLFAWYRPLAAFISGVLGGVAVKIFGAENKEEKVFAEEKNTIQNSLKNRMLDSFKYAFGEFTEDIAIHFIVGLIIAALIGAFLPADFIVSIGLGSGIVSMLLMIIIGAPMYICSTSSIPIAVMLMAKGLSPGAAFVFLFMGPFTNAASLILISKSFGRKTTALYFLSAAVSAIGFGYLLDYIVSRFSVELTFTAALGAEPAYSFFQILLAFFFIVLVLYYTLKRFVYIAGKLKRKTKSKSENYGIYTVEGMDCKNCAIGLETSILAANCVDRAEVDFNSKQLKVWGCIDRKDLVKLVEEHGYSLS